MGADSDCNVQRRQGESSGERRDHKDRAKNYQVCGGSRNDHDCVDVELANPRERTPRCSAWSARRGLPHEGENPMKRSLLVVAPVAFVIAACSADSTSPIQISAADVDQAAVISASDATAEDVSILSASDMTMSGGAVQNVTGGSLMLSRIP